MNMNKVIDYLIRKYIPSYQEMSQELTLANQKIQLLEKSIYLGDSDRDGILYQLNSFLLKNQLSRTGFVGDCMLTMDKAAGFMDDEKFREVYKNNALDNDERGRSWRLHTLLWAAGRALSLPGDFVECGTFEGFMSRVIVDYLNFKEVKKKFYLYDTFNGMSESYSSPDDFGDSAGFYHLAQKTYKQEGLYERVKEKFLDYNNVEIVAGIVPDILHSICPERISFLHLDLNSPRAEKGAMEYLFDRMVSGGSIVLDDYGWKVFEKQKIVADTFFNVRGYTVLELPTGQGLVIK